MANELLQTQRISDETIQSYISDLMRGWRCSGLWLEDAFYQIKKEAAEALSGIDPEYLYPFLHYLGVSGEDYEQALKKVKKYSQVGGMKHFWLGTHRNFQNLLFPILPQSYYEWLLALVIILIVLFIAVSI